MRLKNIHKICKNFRITKIKYKYSTFAWGTSQVFPMVKKPNTRKRINQ